MAAMQRSEGERKRSHRVLVVLSGAQGPELVEPRPRRFSADYTARPPGGE